MTELPNYEIDQPTAYEWTARAFDLLTEGELTVTLERKAGTEIVTASGKCPRCEHDVGFIMELEAPLPGPSGGLAKSAEPEIGSPDYVALDVVCRCFGDHSGRPKDAEPRGCGITFRVEVLRPADVP